MPKDPENPSDFAKLPSVAALRSFTGAKLSRLRKRYNTSEDMNLRHRKSQVAPARLGADALQTADGTEISLDELGLKYCEDEGERLIQLRRIRDMPCTMAIKKTLRDKLMDQKIRSMGGFSGWKVRQKMNYKKYKMVCRNASYKIDMWRSSFKEIEGHFGTGVLSYFIFLKWLFQLNIGISTVILLFIIIPQAYFDASNTKLVEPCASATSSNLSRYDIVWYGDLTENCSNAYTQYLTDREASNNDTNAVLEYIADFFQGTGFMENTVLFYGYYSSENLVINISGVASSYGYDMSIAFIVVTAIYFFISLILMVRQSAYGFKETIIAREDKFYQHCNIAFGSWDFALSDVKNVKLKKKSIFNEIKHELTEQRDLKRRKARSTGKMCGLWILRMLINIVVLAVLGGSGFLIYYITDLSSTIINSTIFSSYHVTLQLLIEFSPSLTITVLNIIVPQIFEKIVQGEDYTPATEVKLTLIRTVFLRLASLGVLILTLYTSITCTEKDTCNVGTNTCQSLYCWETSIGQQLYKLVLLDLIVVIAITLIVEFPRRLIVAKCDCKLSKMIGFQQFVIPKNVLDLVYSQTLCWLGAFFSPLLPAICIVKLFIVFYIKKISLLTNHVPNSRPYRASRSNFFFVIVLLLSFMLCCFIIIYCIVAMSPSRGCGPFRQYGAMFEALAAAACDWPEGFQQFFTIVTSVMFNYPVIVVLCLTIYYLQIISTGHKDRGNLLKEQLLMEGKDKQFLLEKVNELQGKDTGATNKKNLRAKISQTQSTALKQSVTQTVINEEAPVRQGTQTSIRTSSKIEPTY